MTETTLFLNFRKLKIQFLRHHGNIVLVNNNQENHQTLSIKFKIQIDVYGAGG